MEPSPHPTEAKLRAFNAGVLAETALDAVCLHLDRCPICCSRLSELESSDQVLAWLRQIGAPTQDGAVTEAVQPGQDTIAYQSDWKTDLRNGSATVPAEPPSPSIPGYEIEGVLGRGGMGIVYKARQLKANRIVALKMMLSSRHASVPEQVRFQIEAEAIAHLQHPNIVQLHDVGEHDGMPFFSLEFCAGGSLDHKLKTWIPTTAEAVALVETLARAMHHAHLRGVVHRDLKPANILFAGDGTPKITDFGLAKKLDFDCGISRTGIVLGTASYMAPCQAAGKVHATGPAADVYALGAILYELLAGRPPFKGETVFETIQQVLTEEPTPPSRRRAGMPWDLDTICLKCLRKEPENRYASAAELADDLARYQQGEPILGRPVERIERAGKWVKRNPVVAGAAVAVILALSVGTTVSYLKYLDAERQKGIAEEKRQDALVQKEQAQQEAEKAKKARDFLVSIFRISETDIQGGNKTARQIVADAEKRIADEFADQPQLREELLAAIADVKRNIARGIPCAMILEARGSIQIRSVRGPPRQAVPQVLLFPDDRLALADDAEVQLVFLSDLHKERLKAGRKVTVDTKGCEPADAVLARDASVLMTFVRLPKGTFYMGGGGGAAGKLTEIKEDFEIAVHTVTQGQWEAVMGTNPSWFSRKGNGRNSVLDISDEELKLFPVESVSWHDAQAFIQKLNEQQRDRGWWYRLPTEAEWEYACRGGATSQEECSYHCYFAKPTNDLSSEQANFDGNFPLGEAPKGKYLQRPARVGTYPPNKLGLCDMHGNMFHWCADLYEEGSADRPVRGGNWLSHATICTATGRRRYGPLGQLHTVGYRLVRVSVAKETVVEGKPSPAIAPFDAPHAKKHQEAWAKYLKVPLEAENKIGMKLVLIPPTGAALPKAYYLGKYEVTQGEWEKVMGDNPSSFAPMDKKLKGTDTSKFPVEMVSWYDSVEFCNKLSEREGLKPYYELKVTKRNGKSIEEADVKILGGSGYHIPTDAEWEHGCRGGTKTQYHHGDADEDLPEVAWFDKNSEGRTHVVGQKKPNAFGLHDMHGNVFEWNEEMLSNAESKAPERVLRGGHWNFAAGYCEVSFRDRAPPAYRSAAIGFRLARTPVQEQDRSPRVPGTIP